MNVFTIGHSTRLIEEFIELLQQHEIVQLVDIRTIPASRHNPQYGQQQLRDSLEQAGIEYRYIQSLGGLRPAAKHSVSGAWRNKSFRNYADYMQTADFRQGLQELEETRRAGITVIMCAEAVPWRCHRSLVADALVVRGVSVSEIISKSSCRAHALTSFAHVEGTNITYPGDGITDE